MLRVKEDHITVRLRFSVGWTSSATGSRATRLCKKAKQNVDRHFAVVAVLEEIEKSLRVLEHYVPRFFTGVGQAYQA